MTCFLSNTHKERLQTCTSTFLYQKLNYSKLLKTDPLIKIIIGSALPIHRRNKNNTRAHSKLWSNVNTLNRANNSQISYFEIKHVCLFVCLHAHSVQRHTWVLMGPDSNKMLKPGFSSLVLRSMEIMDRNR